MIRLALYYDVPVESADILAQLAAVEIHEAIFVGTSRGGLHIAVLAAARPALVRGAVVNDFGPVIELQGLTRIRQICAIRPRRIHSPTEWITSAR